METKVCSKCGIEKEVCEFYKNPKKENEIRPACKICMDKSSLKNYYNNIEVEKERKRKYHKQYYLKNKEKENLRTKKFREDNLEKVKEIQRSSSKKIRENDPEKHRKKTMEWRKNNPKYNVEYNKNRKKVDEVFNLKTVMRSRIKSFLKLKNITKQNKTFDIVGCTPQYLKEYIESKFIDGMNWSNHGLYGWHIDHIIPLSSANTEDEIYKLCHYTNLQPLWSKDNLKKSNKVII
jgi:hypothetical protein